MQRSHYSRVAQQQRLSLRGARLRPEPFKLENLTPDAVLARITRTERAIADTVARQQRAHACCKWNRVVELGREITEAEAELTAMYAHLEQFTA